MEPVLEHVVHPKRLGFLTNEDLQMCFRYKFPLCCAQISGFGFEGGNAGGYGGKPRVPSMEVFVEEGEVGNELFADTNLGV